MRKYTPKDDVQKKAYFSDRFFISPNIPKYEIFSDSVFAKDYQAISKEVGVNNAYIEHTHLVLIINKNDIVKAMRFLKEELNQDNSGLTF